jgi:succinate-semialdehyde dehydrogenase/glutarate-semialdehyde dehydrogenase
MGPLNSSAQLERIAGMVADVQEKGEGTVLSGGCPPGGAGFDGGYFYRPTLITDVAPGSRVLTEEVFGPVLPVITVPDLDTAIREANRTRFGLGASVWTSDLSAVKRVFREVRAGIVWVNRHLTVPPELPFGGISGTGIGRENGRQALRQYTQTKTLLVGW